MPSQASICITQGVRSDQSAGWHRNLLRTAFQVVSAGCWVYLIRVTWCCTCILSVLSLAHNPPQVGGHLSLIAPPPFRLGGQLPPLPPRFRRLCYLVRLRSCERKSVKIGIFWRGWVTLSANFRWNWVSHTNHCRCQKTRVIALSCGIEISAVHRLVLSQSTRVTVWQTDGQTELRLLRLR